MQSCQWPFGLFLVLTITNKTSLNTQAHILVWTYNFLFLEKITIVAIASLYKKIAIFLSHCSFFLPLSIPSFLPPSLSLFLLPSFLQLLFLFGDYCLSLTFQLYYLNPITIIVTKVLIINNDLFSDSVLSHSIQILCELMSVCEYVLEGQHKFPNSTLTHLLCIDSILLSYPSCIQCSLSMNLFWPFS